MRNLSLDERNALLAYLQQTPLAVEPRYLGAILALANGRHAAAEAVIAARAATRAQVAAETGVAVIPIHGAITHRANCLSEFLGLASVEEIRTQFRAALDDPNVGAIAFDIDSPGGEVAGIADLAAEIRGARGRKPMTAIANEAMYSAAYWLGSAADRVVLTQTAGVGSIGVIAMHVDESGMYEQAGAKVTVVKSGKRKAQFNAMEPLTEEARADLEAEVNRLAELFFAAVVASRDGVTVEDVRALEGGTVSGKAAVKAGLADEVTTAEAAIAALHRAARRATPSPRAMTSAPKEHVMADDPRPETPPANVTEITAAVEQRERKRAKAIRNVFTVAGYGCTPAQAKALQEKCDALIDSGATVEEANEAATTLRASFQEPTEINGTQSAAGAATDVRINSRDIFAARQAAIDEASAKRQRPIAVGR